MRTIHRGLLGLAALVLCGVSVSHAQDFTWGVKAGLNIAGMSNSDYHVKVGFVGGVFGDYRVLDPLSVSAEVLYSRQGLAGKDNLETGGNMKFRLKTHYLNIPILANFHVTNAFTVKAGIQPGIRLGARAVTKVSGQKTKTGVGSQLKGGDFSIPVGVSYDFGLITLDARYNIGVTNVLKNGGTSRNNVFQLTGVFRL